MKRISVGSKNPVKVAAVENAVKRIWPDAEVIAVDVFSGVTEQPKSDDEAIDGATNRAKLSLQETNADLGIGLESCTIDTKHGMFTCNWVIAVDKNGRKGIGCGGKIMVPEKIAAKVRKGKELGPAVDEFANTCNIKQKQGLVGVLTNNIVTRTESSEKSVTYALARFMNPHYYE